MMSIKAMVHYLDRDNLKGNEKLCMVILADYANDDGECYPGQSRIANRLCMTVDGARRVLYRLKKAGELQIINGRGVVTKTGPTSKYKLISFINGCTERTTHSLSRVVPSSAKGGTVIREGCTERTTDPLVNPQRTTRTENVVVVEEKFSQIVKVYENEIGLLTATISDELQHMIDEYPHTYIEDAIKIAAQSNKRSLRYVKGILNNWRTNGKQDKKSDAQSSGLTPQQLMERQKQKAPAYLTGS